MSHSFIRMILLEFLLQRSGNFLFYIRHHSRYSNTFPAYIDCCVLIPVHSISACTLINAITQLQIFFYVSTAAAGFGTGIPAVNTDPFLPGTFHFICQKIREHSPAIVMNTLSKTHILAYFFHIQIFHAHDIIGIGYLPRLLMQKILSLMCDMCMDPCRFLLLLFITVTPLVRSGSVYATPLPISAGLLRKNEDMPHKFLYPDFWLD